MDKDYKRLTIRNDDGTWGVNHFELANEVAKWQEQHATQYLSTDLTNILGEKLADLEDKMEQGLMIELPCKVGDTVYTIDLNNRGERVISEAKIAEIVIFENGVYYNDNTGVWLFEVFKTKAEAEAKVRELKGERE